MAVLTNCLPAAWGQEPQGHVTTAQFQNPLFAGDYADPTILRSEIFMCGDILPVRRDECKDSE